MQCLVTVCTGSHTWCDFQAEKCSKVAVISTRSLSIMIASNSACTHSSWKDFRPLQPLYLLWKTSKQGSEWSQGRGPRMWIFPSQLPPRGAKPIPMPFFCPIQLYGGISCSFVCITDILPISSWFSVRIVSHKTLQMWFWCVWGRGRKVSSTLSYSAILILSSQIVYFFLKIQCSYHIL